MPMRVLVIDTLLFRMNCDLPNQFVNYVRFKLINKFEVKPTFPTFLVKKGTDEIECQLRFN